MSSVEIWQICLINLCCVLRLSILTFALSRGVGILTNCVCVLKFSCMESRVYAQRSHPAVQPKCGHGIDTGNRTLRHKKPASMEAFITKLMIFDMLSLTSTV